MDNNIIMAMAIIMLLTMIPAYAKNTLNEAKEGEAAGERARIEMRAVGEERKVGST
jgi:hypothetical protein